MRVTYRRHRGNREYWNKRWQAVEADLGGLNLSRYPGLYAERALECDLPDGPMLEAGCGAGRVLLHYHRNGHPVVGFDFVHHALEKIRSVDGEVPLLTGDILQLPFASESFSSVMAFGVYHNLESGIEKALAETRRTLKPGGVLCASMRADNIQNQVIDWLATRKENGGTPAFHKANYSKDELDSLFAKAGFEVSSVDYVENMPFLYKFRFFRNKDQRQFDERNARQEGYKLSPLGKMIQNMLIRWFPASFCNVYVFTMKRV